jgi:hypothetical protein
MKKLVLVLSLVGISIGKSFGSVNDSIKYPIEDSKRISIIEGIENVILKNYPGSEEYKVFESRIDDYINQKMTGEKSKFTSNFPDTYLIITFNNDPTVDMITEIVQNRIDWIKSSGYPITPDRHFTKFVERDGKLFLVVALDETYIYPSDKKSYN